MASAASLKSGYNAFENHFAQGEHLPSHEGPRHGNRDEYGDDFRNEREGNFLNLGQCLEQRNSPTNNHGDHHCRAGRHNDRPDRQLHDF